MANSKIMKCWNCGTDIGHQSDEDNFFWCNSACREAYEGGIRQMDEKLKQRGEVNARAHRTGVPAEAPSSVTRLEPEPEPVTEGVPEPLQFPVIDLPRAEILPLELASFHPAPEISAPETPEAPSQPADSAPEPLRVPIDDLRQIQKDLEIPFTEGPAPGLGSNALPVPKGASEACTGKKQRICGNCGEAGHNKRTCPLPLVSPPTPLKEKRCGNCGKTGHNARTCKAEAAE